MGARPEFSVLVTCHYEAATIDEFFTRLKRTWDDSGRAYEIVMVNDGSTDGTWERLVKLWGEHEEVTAVLDFYKNAGQQAAATAAVCEASGEHFFIMDSDLQLAPEDLPTLLEAFDAGNDIVSGYRENRQDSLFRILPSKLANVIMRKASESDFRDFGCTFKIFRGGLIRAFELGPYQIWSNVDFIAAASRLSEVPVSHRARPHGKSGWTFTKLWRYNMDNLVKISQRPFQFVAFGCVLLAGLFTLRILGGFVTSFGVLAEVTNGLLLNTLVLALLVLMAILAMVGEFTIRCFTMLRRKPGYIVREMRKREPKLKEAQLRSW